MSDSTDEEIIEVLLPVAGLRRENRDLRAQVTDYQSRLAATAQSWAELAHERDELRAELAQERNERDATADMLREARAEVERLKAVIVELQQDVERLQQQRAEQMLKNERLRAALERARDSPCSHCAATWLHGSLSTAHHWADQALARHKEC